MVKLPAEKKQAKKHISDMEGLWQSDTHDWAIAHGKTYKGSTLIIDLFAPLIVMFMFYG